LPNESGRTKAKILIVDDHPIVRQGLAMMLNQQDDLHLCCEANNLEEALAAMNACWHDLVIVDISLEGESGITLISKLYLKYPQISILVMSMHEEFVYAERALRLGAKGYIMKQRAVEFIQHAIRCILAGGIYLSDEMHKLILDRMNKQSLDSGVTDPTSVLTLREFEVLRLIGHGFGTRKISEKLNRSIKTIEAHRANIKSKLSLKTNIELIQFASLWLAERD
jgi:DNA-binding NarL/FixJ family response regulator